MERFAGLNVHGFNAGEVFAEILLCCLGQKCLLFRERHLNSLKNFHTTLDGHKKREGLAQ